MPEGSTASATQLPPARRLGFSRYDGCQMSATSCEDSETGSGPHARATFDLCSGSSPSGPPAGA